MSFCAKGNPEEVNVIFLCNSEDGDSERYMRHTPIPEGVKVIDLSPDFRSPEDEESPWVYAVPELNRKPLVRGAVRASIPDPLAHIMLLALLPLAKNLLLNAPIHVNMVTPSSPERPGEVSVVLEHEEIGEAQRALQVLQSSCSAPIHLISIAGDGTVVWHARSIWTPRYRRMTSRICTTSITRITDSHSSAKAFRIWAV